MFASGTGDQGSILGWVIPKTQKMVLDAYLINTQHYKVRIVSLDALFIRPCATFKQKAY